VYALSARVAEAVPLLEQTGEQAASMEIRGRQSLRLAWLSEAHLLAGRMEDATQLAWRAVELARDHKEWGDEAWALRLLDEVAAHHDSPAVEQAEDNSRDPLPRGAEDVKDARACR
jgi:hypothetical protein